MSYTCPFPLCGEPDTFEHAKVCPFMRTKFNPMRDDDYAMAEYIVRLNHERSKDYKYPII